MRCARLLCGAAGAFYIPAATMKIHRVDLYKYFHYGSFRSFIFCHRPSLSLSSVSSSRSSAHLSLVQSSSFSPPSPFTLLFPRAAVDTLRLSVTSLLINVVARRSERFIPS